MPGDVPHAGIKTLYYIQSETAFNHARTLGRLEIVKGKIRGQDPYLLSLQQVVDDPSHPPAIYHGLQDIALEAITGSAGRERDFTRHFFPVTTSERQKERWRNSYTLAMTNARCPPITVCQVDRTYFVINGHHRVSVARYLNLKTIQAHVSRLA